MKHFFSLLFVMFLASCSSSRIQNEFIIDGSITKVTELKFNSIDLLTINNLGDLLPFEYVYLKTQYERGSLQLKLGIDFTLNYIGYAHEPIIGQFDYDIYIKNDLLRKGQYNNPFDFQKNNNTIKINVIENFELPENFYEQNIQDSFVRFFEIADIESTSLNLKLYNFHSILDSSIINDTITINRKSRELK